MKLVRPAFNLLTAISLALFLASGTLWVRGHWHSSQLDWKRTEASYWLDFDQEGLSYGVIHELPAPPATTGASIQEPELKLQKVTRTVRVPLAADGQFTLPGFRYEWGCGQVGTIISGGLSFPWFLPNRKSTSLIFVHWWFLTSITSLPPLLWTWIRWRPKRLIHSGACVICGYDLRATPFRCPECGTAPSGVAA